MNRRSFGATVGVGLAAMCGLAKAKAKSEITVHGPEWIDIHGAYGKLRPTLSLRFENVPLQSGDAPRRDLLTRLKSISGVVNRSDWRWYSDDVARLPVKKGVMTALPRGYRTILLPRLNTHLARTLMLTDFGFSQSKNDLCRVMCAFTPARDRPPWPGSHRPVDFETEILKALAAS